MTEDARHDDVGGGVFEYVRSREDALRRELVAAIRDACEPLHARIGKRREELQAFRDTDFATVGEEVGRLAHDLARGTAPGWVAMRLDSIDAAIEHERRARSASVEDARNAAREYADGKVAELRREVETLTKALGGQAETLTWFQRAVFGAMFVALTSLAVQVLLLTKGG